MCRSFEDRSSHRSTLLFWWVALAVGWVGLVPRIGAQPIVPLGDELQINTYSTNFQRSPQLAVTPGGDFVVVWESRDQDYAGYGVFAQRFDSTGAAVGGELQVNGLAAGDQLGADVAMDSVGGFVVVWSSSQSAGSDSDNRSVQMRRFDAAGAPLGADQQVNSDTTGVQQAPALAMGPDGRFLVVWEGLDGDGDGIRAQLFASDGTPSGGEIAVNSYTTDDQNAVAVAEVGTEFVVVWQSAASPDDADGYSLRGRLLSSSGAPLGAELQINVVATGDQLAPAVSGGSDGEFVVSWHRFSGGGLASEIFARRFTDDGQGLGAEFQVNTYTTGSQRGSDVVRHGSGNFVVAWGSDGSPATDTDGYSVQGRLLSPGGALLGEAFQVNTYTTSYQTSPRLGVDSAGRFVVAWSSFQNIGLQGETFSGLPVDDRGVRGQRLQMQAIKLSLPPLVGAAQGETVDMELSLDSDVQGVASLAFAIDYDETCLGFDPDDGDMDGLPDAFTFTVPAAFDVSVAFDAADDDGEIDVLIADVPPEMTLPDGVLGTLRLEVLCAAALGAETLGSETLGSETLGSGIDAPVRFSRQPPISAGDAAGQSLPAQGTDGVVRVLPGPRGDCNGDRAVDAADLGASGLELFDGDGSFWLDVPDGSFVGSPVGCDANLDQTVDAGDVSCIGRRIFAAVCSDEAVSERPEVRLPILLPVEVDDSVVATIFYQAEGASINSLVMSLDYDATRLAFDATDADMDGLPDAVTLLGATSGLVDVSFDAADSDGELDIFLTDADAVPQVLADGALLQVRFQSLSSASELYRAVLFASQPSVSFGDVEGRSVLGEARVSPPVLFADGFESGTLGGWSASQP